MCLASSITGIGQRLPSLSNTSSRAGRRHGSRRPKVGNNPGSTSGTAHLRIVGAERERNEHFPVRQNHSLASSTWLGRPVDRQYTTIPTADREARGVQGHSRACRPPSRQENVTRFGSPKHRIADTSNIRRPVWALEP